MTDTQVIPSAPINTTMDMIVQAVAGGAPIETIERLIALQERGAALEAKRQYTEAMARFKANVPTILKTKHVEFELKTGGKTAYNHATLDNVCAALMPALSEYGFSHSWEPEVVEGGAVRVTVVISHVGGHSESATLQGPPDLSGGKNPVQGVISTSTYLARTTLLLRLGMATRDMDDDGRGGYLTITKEESIELAEDLKRASGNLEAFCAYMGVENLSEIKPSDLPKAREAIKNKLRKGKEEK